MYHQPITYNDFLGYALSVATQKNVFWADTVVPHHVYGRYSFICTDPILKIYDDNPKKIFDDLKELLPFKEYPIDFPFQGGFLGFFSYNFGHHLHEVSLPLEIIHKTPLYEGGIYDLVLYADHIQKKAGCFALPIHPYDTPKQRVDWLLSLPVYETSDTDKIEFTPLQSQEIYQENVETLKEFIASGDIFQANIARYFKAETNNHDDLALYLKLRETNSAPFACFIKNKTYSILSSSPERFLKLENNQIETRPIKGTLSDKFPPELLENNQKDRSENIMITDLMRNDISRSSLAGSVHVPQLCEVETYKGLHHLVSVIHGTKKPELHPVDILKNAFPGGSITGAPKKRAMELISQIESMQRGAYCGSAGYISFNHNMDMNILIRTIEKHEKTMFFGTGCGITYESNAFDEYQESCLKAQKIIESFL